MTELPEESCFSLRRGMWFVFPLGARVVRAWGGTTGVERVYLDDELVAEGRSLRRGSVYSFPIDGAEHAIVFATSEGLTDPMVCRLERDGVVLGAVRAERVPARPMPRFWLPALLIGGVAVGLAIGVLQLSRWIALVPVLAVLAIVFSTQVLVRIRMVDVIEERNDTFSA